MYRHMRRAKTPSCFPRFISGQRKGIRRHRRADGKTGRKLFGEGGFAKIVEAVAEEERALGIYELDRFTPKIEAD